MIKGHTAWALMFVSWAQMEKRPLTWIRGTSTRPMEKRWARYGLHVQSQCPITPPFRTAQAFHKVVACRDLLHWHGAMFMVVEDTAPLIAMLVLCVFV